MKPTKISRRSFIRNLTTLGTLTPTSLLLSSCSDSKSEPAPVVDNSGEFNHGVASGDPLAGSVIIWTRLTPKEAATQTVAWEVAIDEGFTQLVSSGDVSSDASRDYTVKVDVAGLAAGTTYYYRFIHINAKSATGKTRTLPQGSPTAVKLAVFSCANYPAGFFNVYAEAAKRDDLDAAVFLGDYLYEYDKDGYASEDSVELGRVSAPVNEIISVDDYRQRYAQYRTDTDLQDVHANLPFIVVWDDHEFANNAYIDGAENHDDTEGPYLTRQANALKAFYEWMPIRQQDPGAPLKIYRSFDFGDLLSLNMLDTRVIGRDKQLDYANYIDPHTGAFDAASFQAELTDQNRQLLGAEQTTWLQGQMTGSSAQWQVLGQQVLMGRMDIPAPVAQQQISFSAYSAIAVKAAVSAGVTQIVENLKYANTHLRGYLVVEFTKAEALAEWIYVDTVKAKTYAVEAAQGKTLKVLPGSGNRSLDLNL